MTTTTVSAEAKQHNGVYQPMVDYCLELFDTISASQYRQSQVDLIVESNRIYNQKTEPASWPWKNASNVILPLLTITIDNLEPRLVAAVVGRDPVIIFEMEGAVEQDEAVKALEDWYDSKLKHDVDIKSRSRAFVHKLLLDGTVYTIPQYTIEEKMVRLPERMVPRKKIAGVKLLPDRKLPEEDKRIIAKEGGRIDFVPFTDIYIPDDANDWEKTPVIRMVRPTYMELMRNAHSPNQVGYIPENVDATLYRLCDDSITDEQKTPLQLVEGIEVNAKKTVECLECHIPYIWREEGQDEDEITDFTEERIIALIEKSTGILLRVTLLREINYVNEHMIKRARLFPEEDKAYGKCYYEKLRAIQNGASDIFNLILNIATVVMIPFFFYSDKTGMPAQMELCPGMGYKVDDPSSITFPKFNIDPKGFIEFVNLFISLWERVGSIGDLQIGRPSDARGGAPTATEAMIVVQEGNIKHNYQADVFKSDFLSVLKTLYDLYCQNNPRLSLNYHGNKIELSYADMQRNFKFKLSGSTDMANKIMERKVAEDLLRLFGQDPLADPIRVRKDVIEAYKPNSNPMDYIKPAIAQMIMALQQNPELPEVIKKYMATKQEIVARASASPLPEAAGFPPSPEQPAGGEVVNDKVEQLTALPGQGG